MFYNLHSRETFWRRCKPLGTAENCLVFSWKVFVDEKGLLCAAHKGICGTDVYRRVVSAREVTDPTLT